MWKLPEFQAKITDMKFFYSDHFLLQRSEQRKISKRLAQLVCLRSTAKYFDTFTKHKVAISKARHQGKLKNIMVAYDTIGEEIWVITAYPLRKQEIENRVKRGRWITENEKN